MSKGGGMTGQTKNLQKLQSIQTKQALEDRKRAQSMQEEDQRSSVQRQQMGALSNILAPQGGKTKLGQ